MTATLTGRPVARDFAGERDQVAKARDFVGQARAGHPACGREHASSECSDDPLANRMLGADVQLTPP